MAYGLNLRTPHTAHSLVLNMATPGQDVLEIGCAGGYLLDEFHKKGCRVTGIDRDIVPSLAARKDFRVIAGDIQHPATWDALQGRQFDVVVLADILEHLANPEDILRRVKSFLKPAGIVLVSVPNVANWKIRGQLLLGEFNYRDEGILDRTHLRFFTKDTIEHTVAAAGYDIKEFHPGATRMPRFLLHLRPTLFAVHLVYKLSPKS